ncbi:hypothetical protein MBLNU13_g10564t1 [Cladosporium sp. NU13]
MGRFLLQRARKQVSEEAERLEREKVWEAQRLARERERARVEAEREKVREAERLEKEKERARVEAENAARWEVQQRELDASFEVLTTALKAKMHSEKVDREKKQEKPPAADRCVVM